MPFFLRAGLRTGVASIILLGASNSLQNAIAEGDTRELSFHHLHTGENITITFKRNGRYDEAALKKLDWFMRDWRKQETVHMDPHLFDLLWEAYRSVHATQPIQIVCGYRSPATNAMLRARSSGVAQFSQHTLGHAMDFFIPGVPLEKVREVGLQLQRGGVGFYPTSGSPFVHLDTGSIRHWPRMTYAQLSKVFPDGRTVHIAADGRPLPGYAKALAELERTGKAPNSVSLEAARATGVITASQEQQAGTSAQTNARQPKRTALAGLFNFLKTKNTDESEDEKSSSEPTPKRAGATANVSQPAHQITKQLTAEHAVPLPTVRPRAAIAAAITQESNESLVTASITHRASDRRALQTAPEASPFKVTEAESEPDEADSALSYAPEPVSITIRPVQPMGHLVAGPAKKAQGMTLFDSTTLAATPAMAIGGQNFDNPWARATMLTPSVSEFMTTLPFGHSDPRMLSGLLHKPLQSVVMTFSADPMSSMHADRFSGPAIVFVATASFSRQQTASLR